MSSIFFIGDTHFGHQNIIRFEAIKPFRPFATIEEHDEALIANWNRVVGPKDIVWHLGDVAFAQGLPLVERLNGRKKLVMGNHDAYPMTDYLKYFERVYGAFSMYGYILTHIPVHPQQLTTRYGKGNIHGHLHTFRVMRQDEGDAPHQVPDRRYFCVSAEQIGLTPISLDDLEKRKYD